LKIFLDVDNKLWHIGEKDFPVIENISNDELKWFKEKYEFALNIHENAEITQEEADKLSEEWYVRLCKVALNSDVKTVKDSNCTDQEFGEFTAELYNFISELRTIEEAKKFPLYDPKIGKMPGPNAISESDLQNNFATPPDSARSSSLST